MKNFIIGFLVGGLICGGSAWAASRYITLQDSTGVVYSASNPLQIQAY